MFELGQKIATREAYGKALVALGAEKDFVAAFIELVSKSCNSLTAYQCFIFNADIQLLALLHQ